MHTVEMLELAQAKAERLGYQVRHEWLGGVGGGACEVAGKKVIFVDLGMGPAEQLGLLMRALSRDAAAHTEPWPNELRRLLDFPAAA
jgi:hypothetical protein